MVRVVNEQVLLQGRKSLDIVQALRICAAWYSPPAKAESLTFQLSSMAGSMALEFDLGRRISRCASRQVVGTLNQKPTDAPVIGKKDSYRWYVTIRKLTWRKVLFDDRGIQAMPHLASSPRVPLSNSSISKPCNRSDDDPSVESSEIDGWWSKLIS